MGFESLVDSHYNSSEEARLASVDVQPGSNQTRLSFPSDLAKLQGLLFLHCPTLFALPDNAET